MPERGQKKRCFYVSGFNTKQDFATGRKLDLNASYAVVKEAIEEAGLECVRADEIRHSGTIDLPMFRELLQADLVVADLSTSNVNAAYELGVRHALRPLRTIILAEKEFKAQFDVNHLVIWRYEHLGSDIGNREANRIKTELRDHIRELMSADEPDSPVYLFLRELRAPAVASREMADIAESSVGTRGATVTEETLATLAKLAVAAKNEENFSASEELFKQLVKSQPGEEFYLQQLALVTYKSKQPDILTAAKRANAALLPLHPQETLDPETVGIWAAIQKQIWKETGEPDPLDAAIRSLEKVYALKMDWYNGINLAFLVAARSATSTAKDPTSDTLHAKLLWRRIRRACAAEYDERVSAGEFESSVEARAEDLREAHYWLLATLREACVGLGDTAAAEVWRARAAETNPAGWMLDSTEAQLASLVAFVSATPSVDE